MAAESRTELLLIVGFWTFFRRPDRDEPRRATHGNGPGLQLGLPTGPIALAFFESYTWALLTPFVFWLSSRFSIERANLVPRILLFVGAGIVVAIGMDLLLDFARTHVFDIPRRRPFGFDPLRSIARLWFLNELIVYFA